MTFNNLDFNVPIYGEGKYLWTVIFVDTDNYFGTNMEMWMADSEEELRDQLKMNVAGDPDDEGYEYACEDFDLNMEISIIINKIATIN